MTDCELRCWSAGANKPYSLSRSEAISVAGLEAASERVRP